MSVEILIHDTRLDSQSRETKKFKGFSKDQSQQEVLLDEKRHPTHSAEQAIQPARIGVAA